jgi:hypothetical protein
MYNIGIEAARFEGGTLLNSCTDWAIHITSPTRTAATRPAAADFHDGEMEIRGAGKSYARTERGLLTADRALPGHGPRTTHAPVRLLTTITQTTPIKPIEKWPRGSAAFAAAAEIAEPDEPYLPGARDRRLRDAIGAVGCGPSPAGEGTAAPAVSSPQEPGQPSTGSRAARNTTASCPPSASAA